MESIILATPILWISALFSLIIALLVVAFKFGKILPYISVILASFVIIYSLLLGATIMEVLIFAIIEFFVFTIAYYLRWDK